MKQIEVTEINIADYIKEQKRKGSKYIRWGKDSKKYFRKFCAAMYDANYIRLPRKLNGVTFMGIRHYGL